MSPGYAALRGGAAWMDLSARAKISVAGEDRARLLHAMCTNHIEALEPGQGCSAFFLNAQGRILADANVFRFEDRFLLDTEPELRAKLFEHLDRFIIADDVTLEDQTDQLATVAVEGPRAAEILEKIHAPIPARDFSHAAWQDITIARTNSTGAAGFFFMVPAEAKERLVRQIESAGAVGASAEEARIVRLEHGRPRYGDDISERNLVQETGQLQAVHFNKGCYVGQEIVERVRSQAKLHRLLRRIEIETPDPPAAGTKTDQAEILSAAFSPALAKTVALAYVRTPFDQPGTEFEISGLRARVIADR